jgi:hypothetical protein
MEKKKEENNLDAIEGNLWASILLAKAEYANKPTNQMYSIITTLELTLMELKKLK